MIYTKRIRFMFKMGAYETHELEGSLSINTREDDEVKGFDDGQVSEYLGSALDLMFEDDLAEIRRVTDNDDSYAHFYKVSTTEEQHA